MDKKYILMAAIIVLTLISCQDKAQKKQISNKKPSKEILASEDEDHGNSIDYDNTKVLETLYVTDRNGTEIKDHANDNSKTLGNYEYGEKLSVIEINENWLGVMDRITREYTTKDGTKISSNGWEKIYVARKAAGPISQVYLIQSDLNIIRYLTINQKTDFFEKGKPLNKYLKIELIDQELFDSKKNTSISFLVADTTEIKKTNGIIELKCANKIKKFIDKPDAEENREEYKYVGQIDFLNEYVITGSYWESSDYKLIDKNTGEQTSSFGEYPFISPDKKHVISIYANPYESTADLELYAINKNNKIDPVLNVSFKNWMPSEDLFWSTDNYLYVAVNGTSAYWTADGRLNNNYQYLRIKVLL